MVHNMCSRVISLTECLESYLQKLYYVVPAPQQTEIILQHCGTPTLCSTVLWDFLIEQYPWWIGCIELILWPLRSTRCIGTHVDSSNNRQPLQVKHLSWILPGTMSCMIKMDFVDHNEANYININTISSDFSDLLQTKKLNFSWTKILMVYYRSFKSRWNGQVSDKFDWL